MDLDFQPICLPDLLFGRRTQDGTYAICTAFMALGMMLPGMMAGWLQEHIGYEKFFIWVMIVVQQPLLFAHLLRLILITVKKKKNF